MEYDYYKADGSVEVIKSEKPLSLEKLQELVGGYIEMQTRAGETFCFNEEGLLRGLPANLSLPQYVGNVVKGRQMGEDYIGIR